MNEIQILLAVEPRMLRELLKDLIEREPDMQVVGEVLDPIDLLVAVRETRANVVVHTLPQSHRMPEICTHLFAEYPGLLVIGLSANSNRAFAYRQTISTQPLLAMSIQDVLATIRTAEHGIWPPECEESHEPADLFVNGH